MLDREIYQIEPVELRAGRELRESFSTHPWAKRHFSEYQGFFEGDVTTGDFFERLREISERSERGKRLVSVGLKLIERWIENGTSEVSVCIRAELDRFDGNGR